MVRSKYSQRGVNVMKLETCMSDPSCLPHAMQVTFSRVTYFALAAAPGHVWTRLVPARRPAEDEILALDHLTTRHAHAHAIACTATMDMDMDQASQSPTKAKRSRAEMEAGSALSAQDSTAQAPHGTGPFHPTRVTPG